MSVHRDGIDIYTKPEKEESWLSSIFKKNSPAQLAASATSTDISLKGGDILFFHGNLRKCAAHCERLGLTLLNNSGVHAEDPEAAAILWASGDISLWVFKVGVYYIPS